MRIRPVVPEDADAVWRLLEPVLRDGETYALPRDMTRSDALAYWMGSDNRTFVAEQGGAIVGSTFAATSAEGAPTSPTRRSKALGLSCDAVQLRRGNERARVAAWKSLGFKVVGQLPSAFAHPRLGYVDAFVLFRNLSV